MVYCWPLIRIGPDTSDVGADLWALQMTNLCQMGRLFRAAMTRQVANLREWEHE